VKGLVISNRPANLQTMSTQTQTIEQEHNDNFDSSITAADYEPKPHSDLLMVFCDMCNADAFNTRETLERAGWLLLPGSALCELHSF
jgi:hypothetical protein